MNPAQGVKLSIQNLAKVFGTHRILQHFNLSVSAGEFVSLLGPSGCGKSTLLRLIGDLEQPTSGEVKVETGQHKFFKSFVFQEPNLLPWRTLRQNLSLVFELTRKKNDLKINEVLHLVHLTQDADKYPNQLSGGMKMRASVARALLTEPKLLLLDEPFSALDENTRFRLQEELYAIWLKHKMTIIFVTHSISEAIFLSQRAVLLSGEPAQIVLDHKVQLPEKRDLWLRTDSRFISEVKLLSQSFK